MASKKSRGVYERKIWLVLRKTLTDTGARNAILSRAGSALVMRHLELGSSPSAVASAFLKDARRRKKGLPPRSGHGAEMFARVAGRKPYMKQPLPRIYAPGHRLRGHVLHMPAGPVSFPKFKALTLDMLSRHLHSPALARQCVGSSLPAVRKAWSRGDGPNSAVREIFRVGPLSRDQFVRVVSGFMRRDFGLNGRPSADARSLILHRWKRNAEPRKTAWEATMIARDT